MIAMLKKKHKIKASMTLLMEQLKLQMKMHRSQDKKCNIS